MTNQLQQCIEMVKEWVGNEYLYFDTALQVKHSPHHLPFIAWGLCVSPQDTLYVMDSEQQWYPIEAVTGTDDLVIGSIYQRLKWMGSKYAKAS
jgi:hypothetical protein